MKEQKISSWIEFTGIVDSLASAEPNVARYVFRGHENADWKLTPTLHRTLPDLMFDSALNSEMFAYYTFHNNVLRFLRSEDIPPHLPMQPLMEWWAMMQHYNTPTRLLDWTRSPYVAAYFAACSNWDVDGAVYVLSRSPLIPKFDLTTKSVLAQKPTSLDYNKLLLSKDADKNIRLYFPQRQTERFASQQGAFIYSDNICTNIHQVTMELCDNYQKEHPDKVGLLKLLLPAEEKRKFMIKLRVLNINAQTLFPGVDGLGRQIAEALKIGQLNV
jgi:hypothetical protein